MPPFSEFVDSVKKPVKVTTTVTSPVTEEDLDAKSKYDFEMSHQREVSKKESQIESSSAPSKKKKKHILTTPSTPFLYIRDGDFDIVWFNVFVFSFATLLYAYSFYLLFTTWNTAILRTWIFCYWTGLAGGIGITAGAHRLWAHKSYNAKLPLRIFLTIGQCIAGQNSLYVWCRDHRVHHKFSETDGDPHNTNRGFFFAHCGWLMRKKHPKVILESEKLDFGDLMMDPVVRIQHDYYFYLYFVFALIGPCLIPYYFWGETLFNSFMIVYIQRYMTSLHSTWFVNSTAHMFGSQPYNPHIQPRENYFVSYGAVGEGYHNYHHTFPVDYRTAEDGCKFNLTKKFIDLMAYFGLAYKLRVVSNTVIEGRKKNVMIIKEQKLH